MISDGGPADSNAVVHGGGHDTAPGAGASSWGGRQGGAECAGWPGGRLHGTQPLPAPNFPHHSGSASAAWKRRQHDLVCQWALVMTCDACNADINAVERVESVCVQARSVSLRGVHVRIGDSCVLINSQLHAVSVFFSGYIRE